MNTLIFLLSLFLSSSKFVFVFYFYFCYKEHHINAIVVARVTKGMFRLGVGAKANMSHVACKWAPKAINK